MKIRVARKTACLHLNKYIVLSKLTNDIDNKVIFGYLIIMLVSLGLKMLAVSFLISKRAMINYKKLEC